MKLNTKTAAFITAFILLMCCVGVPTAFGAGDDDLDTAIRELSDYLNKRIPAGNKAVFLNVKSDYPDFSEYIISALIENAVNDEVFTVVDRQQLDLIRAELNFQWSGEVSDASAQKIGEMLGAQTIVSGLVTEVGNVYRIQVRAISVQTASVQGLSSQNVNRKGRIVSELTTARAAATAAAIKREEDEIKKQAATDKFLKSSGINLGGWLGYMYENDDNKLSGGGDIELRLFRYFGLQTGFAILKDEENPISKPIVTQTILQIPVLAKINLFFLDIYCLSAYGGIGINLFPFNSNDAVIQSHSQLSFIAGGELGISFISLQPFVGYQFNRDLVDTAYSFGGKNFSYLGQRSMVTFGLRLLLPFRKSER